VRRFHAVAGTAGIVVDLFARTERHRYGPHRQNRADLYLPRDGDRPHPVVVLLHGGSWRATYGLDLGELIEPDPGGHRSHIDPRSVSWRAAAEWLSGRRSTSPQALR
jgi:hypothetical protein